MDCSHSPTPSFFGATNFRTYLYYDATVDSTLRRDVLRLLPMITLKNAHFPFFSPDFMTPLKKLASIRRAGGDILVRSLFMTIDAESPLATAGELHVSSPNSHGDIGV